MLLLLLPLQEGDFAVQLYYIRPRFGDFFWDSVKATKLRVMLEAAIQRRFPKGLKVRGVVAARVVLAVNWAHACCWTCVPAHVRACLQLFQHHDTTAMFIELADAPQSTSSGYVFGDGMPLRRDRGRCCVVLWCSCRFMCGTCLPVATPTWARTGWLT